MVSKILERLRKLVSHERSAREIGSIAEAEAFAAKIQSLMDEHNLGMTEIEFAQRDADEPIDRCYVTPGQDGFEATRHREQWQSTIARGIAYANNCQLLYHGGARYNMISFVGRTTDREFAKTLFLYFVDLASHLNELAAEQARGEQKFHYVNGLQPWQDYCISDFYKIMRSWKDAWFNGFASALCTRLHRQANESKFKAQQTEVGQNALVHIDKDKLAIKEFLGKIKPARSTGRAGRFNESGYRQGRRQGESVNLTPHTFRSGRTSNLLGA